MQKVLEHEQHAAKRRQMALQAKNPEYKKQLLDMAEVWDRLANERRQGIVNGSSTIDSRLAFMPSATAPAASQSWPRSAAAS
jgi:hypothetical protein